MALLDPPEDDDQSIVIQVTEQPLLVWIWVGGFVMLLGSALSAIPSTKRKQILVRAKESNLQAEEAER